MAHNGSITQAAEVASYGCWTLNAGEYCRIEARSDASFRNLSATQYGDSPTHLCMLHWNSLEIQHPGVSLALVGNLTQGFNLRRLSHKLSVNKWSEILWKTHTQKHTTLASCRPVPHTIVVLGALSSPCCLVTRPCCLARFTRWKQPAISSTSSGNWTKTNSRSAPTNTYELVGCVCLHGLFVLTVAITYRVCVFDSDNGAKTLVTYSQYCAGTHPAWTQTVLQTPAKIKQRPAGLIVTRSQPIKCVCLCESLGDTLLS